VADVAVCLFEQTDIGAGCCSPVAHHLLLPTTVLLRPVDDVAAGISFPFWGSWPSRLASFLTAIISWC